MKIDESLRVPNAVVLLMDRDSDDVPQGRMGAVSILANATAVAIGTLHAADGPTTLQLRDEPTSGGELEGLTQVFEQRIRVPSREVQLLTANIDCLGQLSVGTGCARVRVWTNCNAEPDRVVIQVEAVKPGN